MKLHLIAISKSGSPDNRLRWTTNASLGWAANVGSNCKRDFSLRLKQACVPVLLDGRHQSTNGFEFVSKPVRNESTNGAFICQPMGHGLGRQTRHRLGHNANQQQAAMFKASKRQSTTSNEVFQKINALLLLPTSNPQSRPLDYKYVYQSKNPGYGPGQ